MNSLEVKVLNTMFLQEMDCSVINLFMPVHVKDVTDFYGFAAVIQLNCVDFFTPVPVDIHSVQKAPAAVHCERVCVCVPRPGIHPDIIGKQRSSAGCGCTRNNQDYHS